MLGALAWRRTAADGTRGGVLAKVAVVLGAVQTLVAGVLLVVLVRNVQASQPLPVEITTARDAHVAQLVVGHCLADLPTAAVVDTVRVVPCDGPHAAEVIVRESLAVDAAGAWPGQVNLDEAIAAVCRAEAPDLAVAGRLVSMAPTSEGWARGDRTGLCLALT
ncbi:MAG: septum formation family protein [Micrococcales bacterium]|nr:septum formation family protein [Micrococcales bacterium]